MFQCSFGAKNKEREPKTAQKRGEKEQGGGGGERKETLVDKS